jgi:DNA-binding LytR/AlgR family response regulator
MVQAFINSGEKALRELETNRPEVVLLDMNMKGKMNIQEATKLFHEQYNVPVVFICSNDDKKMIDKAKDAGAYGLLYKPFTIQQLKSTIDFALSHFDRENLLKTDRDHYLSMIDKKNLKEYIFVRADYKLNKIKLDDVFYIEALKDYVVINTGDNVFTTHATMKIMSRILPPREFVRIHRSYIVRLDKIFSIKYPDLTVEGKMKTIPIGGLYRKELYKRLNLI